MDDFGQRGQAVCGTGSVGDDFGRGVVGVEVHAAHVHRSVGRRGGDDDLFSPAFDVSGGFLDGGEDTGRFDHVIGADFAPRDNLQPKQEI